MMAGEKDLNILDGSMTTRYKEIFLMVSLTESHLTKCEFGIILRICVVCQEEEQMGYPAKVQLIQRQDARWNQWYVNFPNAVAKALDLQKGEQIEWEIETKYCVKMVRAEKKKSK
jgi:hypothetical protein